MSDPEDHAHPRMWRPCLPDGEVYPPERAPVRNPAQNLAKPASPLELTLRTFIVHTQTKPGKLWDATRGPQGAQECLICTHRTPSVRRSEGIPPYLSTRVNRRFRTRKVSDPALHRLRCPWGGWCRSSAHSRPSGRSFFRPSRNPHLPSPFTHIDSFEALIYI